jgi:DNA repair exonuclease SbcCD nuclease subunit
VIDLLPHAKLALLAGDTHANVHHMEWVFDQALGAGADVIIQLGDFGAFPQSPWGTAFMDTCALLVDDYNIPLFWIAGNHDDWDWMDELERDENGLAPVLNFHHIPRGTFFRLGGKEWFASGGSFSIDWQRRTKHISIWDQELMTEEFVASVPERKVDIMVSHDCPPSPVIQYQVEYGPSLSQREFTEQLVEKTKPTVMFCGHHHTRQNWIGNNGERIHVLSHDNSGHDSIVLLDLETLRVS